MLLLQLLSLCVATTCAFPSFFHGGATTFDGSPTESVRCPHFAEKREINVKKRLPFDAKSQHISTTGSHAFVAPNFAAGDQRGPCPGLNALANHGYLPHSGYAPSATMIKAVNSVYGLGLDIADILAVYGNTFDGNALSGNPGFSIGGPSPSQAIRDGILKTPPGLSGSHNNYEGDTSSTRGDLYEVGNNYRLQLDQFEQYYNALLEDTPAPQQYSALFRFRQSRFNHSVENNPYFFFPQFGGVLVPPAGYAFPPAMMANHSAEYPEGYLDRETFKSFFAVSGSPGNFQYKEGYERIPENWYRRPIGFDYFIADFLLDVLQFALQDPRLLSVGGNTGTVNSYTGVDVTALTKGVFNGASLAQGNNLQCFIFQLIQAEAPSFLVSIYSDVTKALSSLTSKLNKQLAGLNCPQLQGIDDTQYAKYPGYAKSGGAMRQ